MIENNILAISKVMFTNKNDWKKVTVEQKEQFFFIFNRYFSKKYPDLSSLLNDGNQEKVVGMDLWFEFMKDKSYPQWFWSKATKNSEEFSDKETSQLLQHLDINEQELNFLIKHYKQEIIEELDYLKKLSK